MTAVLQGLSMALVGIFAAGVVRTREPLRQVIALGPFAVSLVLLFTVLQAPDVVLSAIVVGAFAYPVMVLLALAKVRDRRDGE
jgi:energy-converting hydrogenase B subunit D